VVGRDDERYCRSLNYNERKGNSRVRRSSNLTLGIFPYVING